MSAIPADPNAPHEHHCDGCGATATLTTEEAFDAGWDYPPRMMPWGTLGQRTCPNCGINTSAWWAIAIEKKTFEELSERHQETVQRVREEAAEMQEILRHHLAQNILVTDEEEEEPKE